MSSTDAREPAGGSAVPERAVPGGAERPAGQALPARRGGHAAGVPGAGRCAVTRYQPQRRGWILALAVVVVVAAGPGGAEAAGVFSSPKPAASTSGYATGTQPVTRGSLTEQTQENATLGDAGSYTVVAPRVAGLGCGRARRRRRRARGSVPAKARSAGIGYARSTRT
jgi:hypothetical protein